MVSRDKYTGLASPAVYPCYKDTKSRCAIRFEGKDSKIECTNEPTRCSYFRKANKD